MKKELLAGASLLALSATGAWAGTITYSGNVATYLVTQTGTFDIVAAGAQGGAGRARRPARTGR